MHVCMYVCVCVVVCMLEESIDSIVITYTCSCSVVWYSMLHVRARQQPTHN